jgi:HPt (histidine-containing phosphotransfer) domain-containing protein
MNSPVVTGQPALDGLPLLELDAARRRLGGSAAALAEVAQAVREAVPALLAGLDDPAATGRVAHELAAVFGAVGAQRAEAAARAVERAARLGAVPPAERQAVRDLAARTLAALDAAQQRDAGAPPP